MMERPGSLHASPPPPSRLYLPRHFSCSACLYGRLAEPCQGGGCGAEGAEPVAMPDARTTTPPLSPDGASPPPPPPPPRSPSPPASPPSPSPSPSRGREPTVPPSPALRRRAKSLPTPGERGGLRPALQQQSPSRRKTVRFADALGLELTAVRHFCQGDVPRVPARGVGAGSGSDLLKTRRPPALGDLGPVLFGPPAPALEPLFPPHPGAAAGFGERLRRHKVGLEWARPEAGGLRGAVRVLNVAYEKRVSVRYTLNRWASCNEVPAAYQPPPGAIQLLPPDHLNLVTDRFAFHLPVDAGTTLLEFALRYRVAGAEYWDNNDGHNYKLRARPRPPNGPAVEGDGGGGAWIHFI